MVSPRGDLGNCFILELDMMDDLRGIGLGRFTTESRFADSFQPERRCSECEALVSSSSGLLPNMMV